MLNDGFVCESRAAKVGEVFGLELKTIAPATAERFETGEAGLERVPLR